MKPLYTYLIGAVIFFTSLFFIFLWVLSDSGVGGIIKLYSLEQSVEETKVRIDSIVNLDGNLELISGVEYFKSLDSNESFINDLKNHHPQLKSDLRRGYSKFSYIVYSTNSTKKFLDLHLLIQAYL